MDVCLAHASYFNRNNWNISLASTLPLIMKSKSNNDGLSLLGKLDQYWTTRSTAKPKILLDEQLISISLEHWIKYVFPCILYLLLTGAAIFLLSVAIFTVSSILGFSAFFLLGLFVLVCTHHWFFWFLLAESKACIIVTNKRVVHIRHRLLWHEQIIDVAFDKMKTVEAHKTTLLQSLLNYGTLRFESAAAIKYVPHPANLARQIEQAMGLI